MIDLEARARALNERAVADAPPIAVVLGRARRYQSRRRLVAAAAATCVVASAVLLASWVRHDDNGTVQTVDAPAKARAERIAQDLLGRAVLPDGAVPYVGAPPNALSDPSLLQPSPNLVDVHRLWTVDQSTEAVVQFLRVHPPSGIVVAPNVGSRSSGGVVTVYEVTVDDIQATSPTIAAAQLHFSVARRTDTTSWVRADAQVLWRDARDPHERVPATDRVVIVERTQANVKSEVVVTDRRAVARLVESFNQLPLAVPQVAFGCGTPNSWYVVSFSETKASRPDVVATTGCGLAVKVDGRPAAPLDLDVAFLDALAALFAK